MGDTKDWIEEIVGSAESSADKRKKEMRQSVVALKDSGLSKDEIMLLLGFEYLQLGGIGMVYVKWLGEILEELYPADQNKK